MSSCLARLKTSSAFNLIGGVKTTDVIGGQTVTFTQKRTKLSTLSNQFTNALGTKLEKGRCALQTLGLNKSNILKKPQRTKTKNYQFIYQKKNH